MVNRKSLENLKNGKTTEFRSGDEAAISAKKGGIASGRSRRERKAFAEAIREALLMPSDEKNEDGTAKTIQDTIVGRLLSKVGRDPSVNDVYKLAELLGEIEQKQKIEVKADVVAESLCAGYDKEDLKLILSEARKHQQN